MLQFLSFALFSSVLVVSVAVIVATLKAELPYILRALGIDPAPLPPLHRPRAPRIRVIRPLQPAARTSLRAAA
jgi:hypothetical protein